jgi:hypothetical protein
MTPRRDFFLGNETSIKKSVTKASERERESGGGGSGVVDEEENFPQIRKI